MIHLKKFNESSIKNALNFQHFKVEWINQEVNNSDLEKEILDSQDYKELFNVISSWSRIPLEERINNFLDKFNYNSTTREYSFTRDEINYELNKFLSGSKIVPKNDPEKLDEFYTQLKDLLIDMIEDKTIFYKKMNSKISIEYYFNKVNNDDNLDIDNFTDKLKNQYLKFNQFKNYINIFKESNPDAKFKYDNSFMNTFSINIFV